jgi:hypothetical protein
MSFRSPRPKFLWERKDNLPTKHTSTLINADTKYMSGLAGVLYATSGAVLAQRIVVEQKGNED